jgi:hypothetical protein
MILEPGMNKNAKRLWAAASIALLIVGLVVLIAA